MNYKKIVQSASLILVAGVLIFICSQFSTKQMAAGAVDCGSNTCFTSLGVTGNFEVDGTSIIAGILNSTGAINSTGKITTSSTLTVGGLNSTTTAASATFKASDLAFSTISAFPNVAAVSLTLPASTTLATAGFLPNAGDRTSIAVFNASSTAAATVTLVGGTGTLLTSATSTDVIYASGIAHLDIVRLPTSDYSFTFIEGK